MSELLRTENVSYAYERSGSVHNAVIDGVCFSIENNETVGIIGHTGSGKSTLLQTLNGLLKPKSGTVFLDGENLWSEPKKIHSKRFKVGLVFQYPEYQLFEETVRKDIAYGPTNMGLDENEVNNRVLKYANLLGLDNSYLEKSPFDLSGGEKRRVALAGILAMEPEVLVLDEPTAGLDPLGREKLFAAIEQYKKDNNAGIIIVSHSMEDLAYLCDKILVMNKGKAEIFGTVDEVFGNAEKLKNMGLDVPAVTGILLKLKEAGLDVDTRAYTVDKALNSILKAVETEKRRNENA